MIDPRRDEAERIALITDMLEGYRRPVTEPAIRTYLRVLGTVAPPELERAMLRACRESLDNPPGPGRIWQHVRKQTNSHVDPANCKPLDPRVPRVGTNAKLDQVAGSALDRPANHPTLGDMMRRAREIREAKRVKQSWASFVIAAEEMQWGEYLKHISPEVRARARELCE